jgi:hypothetical protein
MNGRAKGTASQATIASPIDTTNPAFVPGMETFPNPSRCRDDFCREGAGGSNVNHLETSGTTYQFSRGRIRRQELFNRFQPFGRFQTF